MLFFYDIFGKKHGTHYEEGLVDVYNDQMYDSVFAHMTKKRSQFEITQKALNQVIIKKSMLRPVREKAGLGSPPIAFTTNASESVNAVLKRKVDYKRNELPIFLKELKELIQEQDNEITRAIIGRGKYVIESKYKRFQKTILLQV